MGREETGRVREGGGERGEYMRNRLGEVPTATEERIDVAAATALPYRRERDAGVPFACVHVGGGVGRAGERPP